MIHFALKLMLEMIGFTLFFLQSFNKVVYKKNTKSLYKVNKTRKLLKLMVNRGSDSLCFEINARNDATAVHTDLVQKIFVRKALLKKLLWL